MRGFVCADPLVLGTSRDAVLYPRMPISLFMRNVPKVFGIFGS